GDRDLTVTNQSLSAEPPLVPRPRATMKQVALLAGVGTKTVSRVINAEPNVTPATAKRVWDAIRTLDYHVDMQAGSLRRAGGRTRTLGLLISSVDNPFAGGIHRAVETVSRRHGVAVFASSLDDDPAREVLAVGEFLRRRVDGLVLTTASEDFSHLVPAIARGTPFVDRAPVGLSVDSVTSDNREAAARATRHLIERGHRRIALLVDRQTIRTAVERRQGFLDELGRAGIPTGEVHIVTDVHDPSESEPAMAALLASDNPPTAVLSAQNLITIGVLHALRAAGRERSLAVVGFDDLPLADLLEPGLTVVAQDALEIGRVAAERVFRRLDGESLPIEHLVVPTRLIERGSGEIPAPGDRSG
ncbi:MAG: LacI family DNA-binding transcriptional regulator, partial [Propionibacteriaceae bacterium]|nr:LacI family DNA-binding transcriptional regulator [Propionibacteriaceae bacterium]